ncbi:hypothetical protein VTJ04DRAFT_10821 [Mycothermus thermophilus]|uniref:uncharacterized protein n=1 Tax=Humicola insolens TaxID=85995 RepID=UPI003743C874
MPIGGVCCASVGQRSYCRTGEYCVRGGGCCPNGRTCTGTGGTTCDTGLKFCDLRWCIPNDGTCCGPVLNAREEYVVPAATKRATGSTASHQMACAVAAEQARTVTQGIIVSHPVPSAAPTDKVVLAVLPAAVVRVKRLAKADASRATLCAVMLARGSIAILTPIATIMAPAAVPTAESAPATTTPARP